jgi:hypothetical protein
LRNLNEYSSFVTQHASEANALLSDLLISVTWFFRDPPVWQLIEQRVIPDLLAARTGGNIAVWVVGCATGEEVYTLAMLLPGTDAADCERAVGEHFRDRHRRGRAGVRARGDSTRIRSPSRCLRASATLLHACAGQLSRAETAARDGHVRRAQRHPGSSVLAASTSSRAAIS